MVVVNVYRTIIDRLSSEHSIEKSKDFVGQPNLTTVFRLQSILALRASSVIGIHVSSPAFRRLRPRLIHHRSAYGGCSCQTHGIIIFQSKKRLCRSYTHSAPAFAHHTTPLLQKPQPAKKEKKKKEVKKEEEDDGSRDLGMPAPEKKAPHPLAVMDKEAKSPFAGDTWKKARRDVF